MNKKKVLLLGDTMLDVYVYCRVTNQALFAPVPEVEELETKTSLGGNGLVARNLLELGAHLTFISVIGADEAAKVYEKFVHPSLHKHFLVDKTRKTTVKKRWYAGGQALLQANQLSNHDLSSSLENKICRLLDKEVLKADIILIMDPQHGLLTKKVINYVIKLSAKYLKPIYVDSQISHRPSNHHLYKGVDTMFLNQKEAKAVDGKFEPTERSLKMIKDKLDLKNVIIKLGENGSVALWGDKFIKSPAHKVKAVDPCGAGDAFLAAFSLGDRNKPEEALKMANIWAALSTEIHGTIPPRKRDLIRTLKK